MHNDEQAIVLCCDERGTRGYTSRDDMNKVARIGDGITILVADNASLAKDFITRITPDLKAYSAVLNPDELTVQRLKEAIEQGAINFRAALVEKHVRLTYKLDYGQFRFVEIKEALGEVLHSEAWGEIRRINLGFHLLVTMFGDGESIILRMADDCRVRWESGYSAIGSGYLIADTSSRMPLWRKRTMRKLWIQTSACIGFWKQRLHPRPMSTLGRPRSWK
jgi:hypothetical protein